MALKRRAGASKSPPILSHEFVIQNHADIVSCAAMVIVIGLLFQISAPIATTFVALQHNASEPLHTPLGILVSYTTGPRDVCIVFFYFLISIVIHAVVQEYVLDKINRKLHLSKTKHSKFNESGQLLTFILISLCWAGEIIRRDGYLFQLNRLWSDYPDRHVEMSYLLKFFFIIQMAYWAHQFPELYFQKVKREELAPRFAYISLYLVFFAAAYVLNFSRIAVVLSFLHYSAEGLFHISRLLYFSNKTKVYKYTFNVWNLLFPAVRVLTLSLSVLAFWYGLAANSSDSLDGNFNTPTIRLASMLGIGLLQAFMMWNFISFHLRRYGDRKAEAARRKKNQATKAAAQKKAAELSELDELPEADQQTPSPVAKKAPKTKLKVK